MNRRKLLKIFGITPIATLLKFNDELEGAPLNVNQKLKNNYHLVIYGGTPGGIACALRGAREGLKVLIVNHNQHLGGMFVNGLGTMDTLYNGARAPIYDELRGNIYDYYRKKYGENSKQYKASKPNFPKTRFESHVIEKLIKTLLDNESNITVLKDYCPFNAVRNNNKLNAVTFRHKKNESTVTINADIFADCSYEGDLAVVSGVSTRIGRESREEFGEKHAGIAYTSKNSWPPSAEIMNDADFKLNRELNLYSYNTWSDLMMPQSTGVADTAIQAFNFRTTLTSDPNNRIIPGKPDDYDPEFFRKHFKHVGGPGLVVPNRKTSWNEPELIGEQNAYVEGDWNERERITNKFRNATLGLLYFMQNDPSVNSERQERMKRFGLSKNEYKDNGHIPYEIYVREARRIEGRSVFTENNATLAKGLRRAPIEADSISITEWFMDSHACTDKTIRGSKPEGEVMLKNKTFPGQVSFNCILPKSLDNLIVPVCLSSTHVGWGTIRLEPTWMSIGEAAGYAAVMAVNQKKSPASIDIDELLRVLAKKGVMISFFNDIEGKEKSSWYAAVQYLGTKGFFGTYEANPNKILSSNLADAWLLFIKQWVKNRSVNPKDYAVDIHSAENVKDGGIKAASFIKRLSEIEGLQKQNISLMVSKLGINLNSNITRGDACRLIFEVSSGM